MKTLLKGFSISGTVPTIALVIITALLAAYLSYAWQGSKINDLNSTISGLKSELANAKKDQNNNSSQQTKQQSTVAPDYQYNSTKGVSISVFAPAKNQVVANPIALIGEIPGNWSFEAQFPILLKNSNGDVVARTTGQVLGDWQTTQLVPFSAQITYTSTQSGSGTIVLEKDNPSGLSQNADTISVPVKF